MFIRHCLTLVTFCTFVSIDWLETCPASSMWPKAMFDDVMLVLQISLEMHVTAWVGRKEEKGALCGRYQSRRRHIDNRLNKASATQKTLTRVQTWRRLPRGVFTLVDHWQTCDTGRSRNTCKPTTFVQGALGPPASASSRWAHVVIGLVLPADSRVQCPVQCPMKGWAEGSSKAKQQATLSHYASGCTLSKCCYCTESIAPSDLLRNVPCVRTCCPCSPFPRQEVQSAAVLRTFFADRLTTLLRLSQRISQTLL